jgi:hypothetical protein
MKIPLHNSIDKVMAKLKLNITAGLEKLPLPIPSWLNQDGIIITYGTDEMTLFKSRRSKW